MGSGGLWRVAAGWGQPPVFQTAAALLQHSRALLPAISGRQPAALTLLPLTCCPSPAPCPPARSGELYPVETDVRLCDVLQTGQEVEVDMEADTLTDLSTGKVYSIKPLGDAAPVIDAGGIFEVGGTGLWVGLGAWLRLTGVRWGTKQAAWC